MCSRFSVARFGSGTFSCFIVHPLVSVLLLFSCTCFAYAAPEGGVVRAGAVQIIEDGSRTLVQQGSDRAIIDWRGFSIGSQEQVQFVQPSSFSATLNRVTGGAVSLILGRLDANGQVLLINPQGIIFGEGARVNVGSLIASTANLSDDNFLKGRLVFDQPGSPGAGIVNAGSITAAEGGLVALVALQVRNDGLIQARLGRVMMGAADTFTIDLYGDGLINLALSDESLARIRDAQAGASLIRQAGTIDVGSGRAVLVTAEVARGVMDSLINMSGTILADSAVQEGGRIHLLARGGSVDVSGELSAVGTRGGTIEVLGDRVVLSSTAKLSADGSYGGGTVHVGGAFQGTGDTYRSQVTKVDAGAAISTSALESGNGGEVIVWSDGHTDYAGSITARGGLLGGDGGLVEVSGKETLAFGGLVDAGAPRGTAGSLLLDPYDFTIGMSEASLINRVLRTGTSTSVSADNNIYVNYVIDSRGRYAGGGLTLSAGNSITINDYIITNNGAINLYAGRGTVTLAPGTVVYAGTAPITVRSGADLYNAPYLTGGLLSMISSGGSVYINQAIESALGSLFISAADDVDINEPIVSISSGGYVTVNAGRDITIDAQVDGRPSAGGNPLGSVTMTAGRDIHLESSIIANSINLAGSGTISAPTMTAGTVTLDGNGIPQGEGLFSGTGPISVTAGGDLSSGIYVTYGPVTLRSSGGDVYVDTKIAEILGDVTIASDTGSVHVDQEIANIRSGSNLAIMAGQDINLNRQIDALDDTNELSIEPVPGGSVTFVTGNNANLNEDLVTYDGAVEITALAGTLNIAWNEPEKRTYRIQSGSSPITVNTGGDLSTGTKPPVSYLYFPEPWDTVKDTYWDALWIDGGGLGGYRYDDYVVDQLKHYVALSTTGKLSLSSTGGNVTVDAPIPKTTGEVAITAVSSVTYDQNGRAVIAGDKSIIVNHKILSNNQPITLTAGSGGITVHATDDNYGIGTSPVQRPAIESGSGPLTFRATGSISIAPTNGLATSNKLTIDTRSKILQGAVNEYVQYRPSEIALIADGGIDSFYAGSSPRISATSSNGAINLTVFDPGELTITTLSETSGDVNVDAVHGLIGNKVNITAGRDINFPSIVFGGVLTLNAGRDANLYTLVVTSLDVTASSIYFNSGSTVWLHEGDLKATSTGKLANPGRPLTTGDVLFNEYSAIHIGEGKALNIDAHKSVELGILEMFGPVSITARTGDITLRNDIGPPIQFYVDGNFYKYYDDLTGFTNTCYENCIPSPDPEGIGVASIYLDAIQGNISMQGAKAAGTVTIKAGGTLVPTKGIFSGTPGAVFIFAESGALEIKSEGNVWHPGVFVLENGDSFGNVPLDPQAPLIEPWYQLPAITPGPAVAPPGPPMALTALPAQPPGLANVSGSGIPGASGGDESFSESEVESVEVGGSFILTEIIPDEDDEDEDEDEEKQKKTLRFSGGRGDAWSANLGRR